MAGRTERLPEDAVEYSLFPVVPGTHSEDEQHRYLSDCLNDYLGHLGGLLIDYVWQNEGFSLAPVVGKGSLPPHLSGSTNFGDNVEDEWFIAHLLFELTKAFPGLVATISDNDGEFLLIEAADALPKWLNPDSAEDRVYVYQGELHVIPIPQSPAEISHLPMFTPNKGEGAQCVRDHTSLTLAPPAVRKLLQKRLDSVPAKVAENVHHAHCYVPANLAAVLDQRPDLIGAAVRAFYYRDPVDLQACRTMKTFPAEDIVLARVRLTRCQYAQLLQQQFQPDKRSGWILPATSNPKFKCHDIGLKLAHGFEILCSRCQGSRNGSANGHHTSVDSDVRWKRFLKTLQKKDFFKGEIEGSQRYKELLKSAKKFFQDHIQQNNKSSEEPGVAVWDILQANNFSVDFYRKREATIPEEDDDSWLYLTPEGLEHLLESRMGTGERTEPVDLQQVSSAMQAFVGGDAGFEGAEFPRDAEDGGDVEFDSTGFIHAMTKMFEFKDDEDEDSDMSEYDSGEDDDELGSPTKGGPKPDPHILELMAQMDRELARTKVGKSFELDKPTPKPKPPPRPAAKEETAKSQSTPSTPKHQPSHGTPKSHSNQATPKKEHRKDVDDEDDDFFRPVNIDVNVIKNSLESYSAQQGLPGPASNILQGMGIHLSGLVDPGPSASPKPNSTPNPKQSPRQKPQRPPPPRPACSPPNPPKPNSNAKPSPNPKPSPFGKPNPGPKPSPSHKANPKVETQI